MNGLLKTKMLKRLKNKKTQKIPEANAKLN